MYITRPAQRTVSRGPTPGAMTMTVTARPPADDNEDPTDATEAPSLSSPESNNSRSRALDALVAACTRSGAALHAPAWVIPGDTEPHPTPTLAVGNVWKQVNGLRVLKQYGSALGLMCDSNQFLLGSEATCIRGLEWFSTLKLHLPVPQMQPELRAGANRSLALFRARHPQLSAGEALFALAMSGPCTDRAMTRSLLEIHSTFSHPFKEYEVDVCTAMLRASPPFSYADWKTEMKNWRGKRGLYYPLLVGAAYMPSVSTWMHPRLQFSPLGCALQSFISAANSYRTGGGSADLRMEMERLVFAWARDATDAPAALAETVDRLAVLMRVKSNGPEFNLDAALALFPRALPDRHEAWHRLKGDIESTFPPSLLLCEPSRTMWGYPRLTLVTERGGMLARFQETELVWNPASTTPLPSNPLEGGNNGQSWRKDLSSATTALPSQTPARIKEILRRTGDIMTSPEMVLCMMYPRAALASLTGTPDPAWSAYESYCRTKPAVLEHMQPRHCEDSREGFVTYLAKLESILPPVKVVRYRSPQHVLLWRMDIPARAIVNLGDHMDAVPTAPSHHTAPKMLLNVKVMDRTVGAMLSLPVPGSEETVRDALRAFADERLTDHPSKLAYVKNEGNVLCTTLAESVACFTLHTAPLRTSCMLGDSAPWQEGPIDARYSERQDGTNGLRFRDWVAVHVDASGTHQSRLAAHAVSFDTLHTTKMPWLGEHGEVRWVRVACTLPVSNKILQGKTLRQAVESRYMHDTRMLPSRMDDDTVVRSNAELYSDGRRVVVAYTPVGADADRRVELMAFEF